MTYPRAHLVDEDNGGFYHCICRCVRRSWLCGNDAVSGRSFAHRRDWIERRLLELAEVFAVEVYAYAVMSNHYHAVVRTVPRRVREWDDAEVARRWCRLGTAKDPVQVQRAAATLCRDAERLGEVRRRLGSLSWFMRYLNEPLARRANREEGCTGRFWEGRFKSVALLDEAAVVGCMAYVDMNPIRAGLTARVTEALHTSIGRRHRPLSSPHGAGLAPLSGVALSLSSYTALLAWTVATERGAVGVPGGEAAAALAHLGCRPMGWLKHVRVHRFKYRAYGALAQLQRYAQSLGQHWIRGQNVVAAAQA